jgi:hypothetical protein
MTGIYGRWNACGRREARKESDRNDADEIAQRERWKGGRRAVRTVGGCIDDEDL